MRMRLKLVEADLTSCSRFLLNLWTRWGSERIVTCDRNRIRIEVFGTDRRPIALLTAGDIREGEELLLSFLWNGWNHRFA